MVTLYYTRGLPGSGKSTLARAWVALAPAERGRVNRDELRDELEGTRRLSREQEAAVTIVQYARIREHLTAGRDVIVDDTNLHPRAVRGLRELARRVGAGIEVIDMTSVPLAVCIDRDSRRTGQEHVGEAAIRGMYARYLAHTTTAA